MKHSTLFALFCLLLTACHSKDSGVTTNASLLNGITGAPHARNESGASPLRTADGTWYLSPDKMTVTLTDVAFTNSGTIASDSGTISCPINFDRSLPSLAVLAQCPFKVTPGDYTGVSIAVSNMVTFQIYDQTNGFYTTTASATNPVTTTNPGSPQAVTLDANNCQTCPSGNNVTTYQTNFLSAVHVDATTTLYVVLDPSQWLQATVQSGAVTSTWATMKSGVSLPVLASISSVAKAELYNNSTTVGAGSTNVQGVTNPLGLHLYFSDAHTPARVDIRYGVGTQPGAICQAGSAGVFNSAWPGNPLPPSNAGEGFFGFAGWLGEDASGKISWVEGYDANGPDWTKLAGVFTLTDAASGGVGTASTFNYLCNSSGIPTSDYPAGYLSSGGPNYSVGAPNLANPGTVTLKLQSQ